MSGPGSSAPLPHQPALLHWRLSDNFGWGILGLNLFREWVRSGQVAPAAGSPIPDLALFRLEAAEQPRFAEAVRFSNAVCQQLISGGKAPVHLRMPVIRPLGNGLYPGRDIRGTKTIGRAIFENTRIQPRLLDRYDLLLSACEWNADLLRAATGRPVAVIHEAVDHDLFFPRPRAGRLPAGRFYIFTGGKVEFRKAQDLVLLAFREFCRRHDDAVLVTAWHSPFPEISLGFRGKLEAALQPRPDGALDVGRWVAENGIDPQKVIDLGPLRNAQLPAILRDMHCALQPSRAEAATNLVAMEVMAMGLPVVIARNTGMRDLIAPGNCLALERQGLVEGAQGGSLEGWGESDIDEILEALERLYVSAELRQRVGGEAHLFMRARTWAGHAEALQSLLY